MIKVKKAGKLRVKKEVMEVKKGRNKRTKAYSDGGNNGWQRRREEE